MKIDTGMNRLGFKMNEIDDLVLFLADHKRFRVKSIFSHLAAADNKLQDEFTANQANRFIKSCGKIESKLGVKPLRHILNSAGIIRFPQYQFDMVRLGIGLYGVENSKLVQGKLKNVSTLRTTISQIKTIKAGETIGYDRSGTAAGKKKIAVAAIGYADGFQRNFSNGRGVVLVNGIKAPVIGRVCMDMTMIDISHIDAKVGDDVIIFGDTLTLCEIAEISQTIPHEVLTGISDRVKRVYYSEIVSGE